MGLQSTTFAKSKRYCQLEQPLRGDRPSQQENCKVTWDTRDVSIMFALCIRIFFFEFFNIFEDICSFICLEVILLIILK